MNFSTIFGPDRLKLHFYSERNQASKKKRLPWSGSRSVSRLTKFPMLRSFAIVQASRLERTDFSHCIIASLSLSAAATSRHSLPTVNIINCVLKMALQQLQKYPLVSIMLTGRSSMFCNIDKSTFVQQELKTNQKEKKLEYGSSFIG
ncbi:hypothetical protein I8J29_06135 [Paenibacillus sp. MWE-103]|uniref:Uncharacterized protein n=1 Tax=Paenibacillus artemisiicola TaxID=1172618 RepID=A0ABS3W657_9BACL|nr:hypothetical protein [Paenibacillus artemisiicola]MBO7743768.1 hypothetical protein [Paenibacillus artemisiicola]